MWGWAGGWAQSWGHFLCQRKSFSRSCCPASAPGDPCILEAVRARASRPGVWVLTSSGTPEEVGRAGRKVSGDRTSSLCQVGRIQTPVAPWVSRPSRDKSSVQLGQAWWGPRSGPGPKPRCVSGNWVARAAQAPDPQGRGPDSLALALPSTKLEEGAGNLSPRQRKWPGKRKRL